MPTNLKQWEERLQKWEADLNRREREAEHRNIGGVRCLGCGSFPTGSSSAATPEREEASSDVDSGSATPSKRRVSSLAVYIRSGKFVRSVVFGGLDGLTTSIVLICSTSGLVGPPNTSGGVALQQQQQDEQEHPARSHLTYSILFTLGMANLIADAFSMGMGDFLSSLAENEHQDASSSFESSSLSPTSASAALYTSQLRHAGGAASRMGAAARRWLRMWTQDAGLVESARNGVFMFLSFVCFGVVPLMAYVPHIENFISGFTSQRRFFVACVLGSVSLFFLGMLKGLVLSHQTTRIRQTMLLSGLKMMLTGSVASIISYAVSAELHHEH